MQKDSGDKPLRFFSHRRRTRYFMSQHRSSDHGWQADDQMTDDFEARSPDELSLLKGERIELIERDDDFGDGWYLGKHVQNGKVGLFPEGKSVEDQ